MPTTAANIKPAAVASFLRHSRPPAGQAEQDNLMSTIWNFIEIFSSNVPFIELYKYLSSIIIMVIFKHFIRLKPFYVPRLDHYGY